MYPYKKADEKNTVNDTALFSAVRKIIDRVPAGGNAALFMYSEKFRGLPMESLKVSAKDIKKAYSGISPELHGALETAAYNIKKFTKIQLKTISPLPLLIHIISEQVKAAETFSQQKEDYVYVGTVTLHRNARDALCRI